MSDVFQFRIETPRPGGEDPFLRFGLADNPFPPAGIESGVLYADHMRDELAQVNDWIRDVWDATDGEKGPAGPVRPLAIAGSLGVGKTHLLRALERGLSSNATTPVLRKGLADEGMTHLVLANLFLRYLPMQDDDGVPGAGLLGRLAKAARADRQRREDMLHVLGPGSPVRAPLASLLDPRADERAVVWLSRWLRREYTTPAQRARLGLSGVLRSEGEAVRAVADLLRVARAAGVLRTWFVMIDQVEELWRPGVITANRRARFLTDLRHLVDQAMEGAPIAVLLAWNTTIEPSLYGGTDVVARMKRDYHALWQRLGRPVDLPPLRRNDIWPFAEAYLEAAGVDEQAPEPRRALYFALRESREEVERVLERSAAGPDHFAPRRVLAAWRDKAREIASRSP